MNNHNYVFYIYIKLAIVLYIHHHLQSFYALLVAKKLHNMLIYIITFVRGYIICNWIDNINSTNGV
jgi:hypothetical protein